MMLPTGAVWTRVVVPQLSLLAVLVSLSNCGGTGAGWASDAEPESVSNRDDAPEDEVTSEASSVEDTCIPSAGGGTAEFSMRLPGDQVVPDGARIPVGSGLRLVDESTATLSCPINSWWWSLADGPNGNGLTFDPYPGLPAVEVWMYWTGHFVFRLSVDDCSGCSQRTHAVTIF